MRIIGIGSEIVECPRIGRMLQRHGESFLHRVYTEQEIRLCQSKHHPTEQFASLWVAKEAIFRAIGSGSPSNRRWVELEVRPRSDGRAQVYVRGMVKEIIRTRRVAEILVSAAHCRGYALAHAIALGVDTPEIAKTPSPPPATGTL